MGMPVSIELGYGRNKVYKYEKLKVIFSSVKGTFKGSLYCWVCVQQCDNMGVWIVLRVLQSLFNKQSIY